MEWLIGFDCEPRDPDPVALLVPDDGSMPYLATGTGRKTFTVMSPPTHEGWGMTLRVTAPGYKPYEKRYVFSLTEPVELLDPVVLEKEGLPRIVLNNPGFATGAGDPWWYCGASDFSLYARFKHGEDIQPGVGSRTCKSVARQRKAAGVNVLRIFCRAAWILANESYDYSSMVACRDLLLEEGVYTEWVVLADCVALNQSLDDQLQHVNRFTAAMAGKPTFCELGNEVSHRGTQIDWRRFDYPGGDALLWSRGSDLSDGTPPQPSWDYVTHHNGRGKYWITHGTDVVYFHRLGFGTTEGTWLPAKTPVVFDEIIRATSQASDPEEYRLFGQIARASGAAGVTAHTDAGLSSDMWPDDQRACAEALLQGFKRSIDYQLSY